MDCLVEVHDEEELKRAQRAGAKIIGINNRGPSQFQSGSKKQLVDSPAR